MAFGKYSAPEEKMIKTIYGDEVLLKKPGGYSGLFWGSVYGPDGKCIQCAQTKLGEIAEEKDEDPWDFQEIIDQAIGEHCAKWLPKIPDEDKSHSYQYGFGGDECDGLIDFWLPERVEDMPDMKFTLWDTEYTMKWHYSGGHDDSDDED